LLGKGSHTWTGGEGEKFPFAWDREIAEGNEENKGGGKRKYTFIVRSDLPVKTAVGGGRRGK